MNADMRKLRSYDFGVDGEPADGRDAARRAEPQDHLAIPSNVNDNTRETAMRDLSAFEEAESDAEMADTEAFAAVSRSTGLPAQPRRRGPLVTRWIGFAARRRQVQARVSRMRDRSRGTGSDPQAH